MPRHNSRAAAAFTAFPLVLAALCHAQNTPAPPPRQASPQQPTTESSPEIDTHDLPPTFTSKVNLVLVRVVVRDKKGKPVGNLKQEDFQLFDRRKPQVITRFSAEKAGGAESTVQTPVQKDTTPADDNEPKPPPQPDHFVAYLFDDVHLNNGDLMQVRNAAAKQIPGALQSNGRLAIYTTSGQTMLDFTDDLPQIYETLAKLMPHPRTNPRGNQCPDLSVFQSDLIVNKNDQMALDSATTETLICANMDPTQRSVAQNIARSTAMQNLNLGESDARLSFGTLSNIVRRMAAMPGQRNLILISPGFLVVDDMRFDEQEIMDRAVRSNVVVNALDARGLFVIVPGGDASQQGYPIAVMNEKSRYDHDAAMTDGDVMAEFASGTGGTFVQNTNDLQGGFQKLASLPEYYYVLGFAPQNLKNDGSYHGLKVSLREPQYSVQARRGYYAPKHSADEAQRAKEELEEALYSRDEIRDIPIDLHTQFFKSTDVNAKLSVVARVDVRHLRFRKEAGRNCDTLTVLSGLFDRNGNLITAMAKTLEMKLKDPTLTNISGAGLSVKTTFDVTPGTYAVRLVVRDSEGQAMATKNGAIEIP